MTALTLLTAAAISWTGTYRLPASAEPVPIVVEASGNHAYVSLGPGHAGRQRVAYRNGSFTLQVFAAYCELRGIAVIADDKRGVGESQGRYPGERATPAALDVLARDAQAEARFLASLPEVDRSRIGVLGDSQAGWVIALAAARERLFQWAVPLVGPTVSVDEADAWGDLAGKGQYAPTAPNAEMLAQARAARGGFDPAPSLRRLPIPVHWVFADDDRNVPTELCVETLEQLKAGHDFTWDVVHATHTLLDLPSGLNSGIPRSRGFATELFPSVGAFLRRVGVVS